MLNLIASCHRRSTSSLHIPLLAHTAPVPEPIEDPLPGEHPVPQEDPVPSPHPEIDDPKPSRKASASSSY